MNSPALPSVVGNNTTAMNNGSDGLTARAMGGLFTNVSFNNSPVNISINLQSNVHPSDSANGTNDLEILKKDFVDKRLVNSVKYHYLSLRLL